MTLATSSVLTRTIRGVVVSGLNQVLLGVQSVILVPFFLRAWDATDYGLWLTISAFVSYLALIDLGGQTYVGNLLALAFGRGDEQCFRKHLSEAMSFFVFVGAAALAMLSLLLCISVNLPREIPLALQPWQASVALLLAANMLLFSVPVGIYATAYAATGRYTRAAMIGNAQRTAAILVSLTLLLLRVRPPVFALGTLVVSMLSTAAFWWDSRQTIAGCRGIRFSIAAAKRATAYLKGSTQFWLMNLANTLRQEGVVIVLASLGDLGAVAMYSTHRTIASIPDYTRALVQAPVTPELSFLWARRRVEDLNRAAMMAIRAVVLVTGGLAIFLWFSSPTLYPLWTHRAITLDRWVLAVLLIQATLSAGWRTSTWGLLASNNHQKLIGWSIANSLTSLLLSVLLVPSYGVFGAVIAGLLSDLALGLAVAPLVVSPFLRTSRTQVYRHFLAALAALLPLALLAAAAGKVLHGFTLIIALGTLTMLLFCPIAAIAIGFREVRRFAHVITDIVSIKAR
jgi:O-antigen/teichoic acid export membrane protein